MGLTNVGSPSTADLLEKVEQIRPILERNGPTGDEMRRVPDESMDALTEAGLFKVTRPRRYGGYETSIETYLEVGAAVARADGATGWLYTLGAVNLWVLGLMSAEAQDDVWGQNPDARMAGVLAPSAESTKVDGGWRVTGRWGFASGCLYADWVVLGFPAVDEAGQALGEYTALIPASDWTVDDTWFVAGMRGTGSNTVVVDDAFVPEHRAIPIGPCVGGSYATPYKEEALYRSAFVPVLAIVLAAPAIGLAQAALDVVIEKAPKRGISYTKFTRQTDSAAFQIAVSKAAMLSDTARLHMLRAAREIDEAAARDVYPDLVSRARARADTGYSTTRAREAIDLLLTAHGAGGLAQVSPLQRIWRDANTGGRHAVVNPLGNEEIYGKALLGIPAEDNITPLI
jgi:alkylation response protein AidB-like acyl-CoA dehydrogenase